MIKNKIRELRNYIFAENENFSLEHRLLLSAIVVGILISIFGSIINLMLTTSLTAVFVPLILSVIVFIVFYFVRFKRIVEPIALPLVVVSILGISIIWIFNGGINGSNIMPSFVIFVLGLIVVKAELKKYIIILFISINIVLLLIQKYRPDLITNFPTETDRWNDNLLTFIYSAYLMFLIITFVHKNYTLEKERAEENEQKFRALVETVSEGILVAQGASLKYVNPMVVEITGYTKKELLSTPFIEFVCPEFKDLMRSNYVKRMSGVEIGNRYPIKIFSKQKGEIWVEMSGSRIVWEGTPALINFVTDITERKQAELKIQQQNDELKKLNADKNRFISILSHDLKSPFNTILGYSELLRDDFYKFDPDQIKERLGIIHDMSENAFNLLEDLLLWIKSQSGKLIFEPRQIDFANTCQDLIENVKIYAIAKNITINYFSTNEIPLFADENMLKTILRNLLSNAIKFTNQNGKINIFAEKEQNAIIISVADNGVGIDANDIPKLWDMTAKYSTTGTANEEGTGLGLLLCKEFVEKHGGTIWVESEVGEGSNFKFSIPIPLTKIDTNN